MTYHHGALVFTDPHELAALLALVDAGYRARKRNGYPTSPQQARIVEDTARAFKAARGQRDVPTAPAPAPSDIPPERQCDTTTAANLLGVSPRQCRRFKHRLGARTVAGRLLFDLATVQEYAQERHRHERQQHPGPDDRRDEAAAA